MSRANRDHLPEGPVAGIRSLEFFARAGGVAVETQEEGEGDRRGGTKGRKGRVRKGSLDSIYIKPIVCGGKSGGEVGGWGKGQLVAISPMVLYL